MDKLTFRFPLNEEQKQKKDAMFQSLKDDQKIKDWLDTNQLDDDFLYRHCSRFYEWRKEAKLCDNCQGLHQCAQPRLGALLDLYYDGILMDQIVKCRYTKEKDELLAHQRYYRMMDMSDSLLKVNFTELISDKETNEYCTLVIKIMDHIHSKDHFKGLYLYGKPGVGKTYIGAAIGNYYAKQKINCAFVNVPKLIGGLKGLFGDNDAIGSKINVMKKTAILILDDIGGESITTWSRDEILLPILDYRMEHNLRTFFTSNFSLVELHQHFQLKDTKTNDMIGADRIMDRIKALSSQELLKGNSRRI